MQSTVLKYFLLPFPDQKWHEGEPQTESIIRQGKADQVSFDLEMEFKDGYGNFFQVLEITLNTKTEPILIIQ